jgi:hypothetical protein
LLLKPSGVSRRATFMQTYERNNHSGNRMVSILFVNL